MRSRVSLIALALFVAACQSQPNVKQVDQQVAAPVNCATAEGDLRTLQSEKASTAKMMADGVTAITPIGLVVGTATGKEKGKLQIASGDYNKMIDQKIAQIKSTCGIP
jgi:uncharacterized protein (UPF0254 family)